MEKLNYYLIIRKIFLLAAFMLLTNLPGLADEVSKTVMLTEAGTLSNFITDDEKEKITNLKVYGPINSIDLTFMAEMTGASSDDDYYFCSSSSGMLSVLDLSEATAATADLIGDKAFYNSWNLTSISLPKGITSIGENAFSNCTSLVSVDIPNTVTKIGYAAFYDCISLTSVVIPNGVTEIGNSAFYNCSMPSITIPEGLATINWNSFANCSKLTSLEIPNSVTKIEGYAFSGCTGLTSVSIGKNVTTIGQYAFYRCTKLTDVSLLGKTLPTSCATDAFNGVTVSNVILYCKTSMVETCSNAATWSSFGSIKAKPFSITVSDAGFATACYDDDLDFSEVSGIKAYIASGYSAAKGKALLTNATYIAAGTGFVVKGNEGAYEIPAVVTDYTYANLLVGTLEKTNLSASDDSYFYYVLANDATTGVGFYQPTDAYVLSANKAYLRIPANVSGDAKCVGLSFSDEDDTTGVDSAESFKDNSNSEMVIYDLNGQRMNSLTKGINIVDGKKIFVK